MTSQNNMYANDCATYGPPQEDMKMDDAEIYSRLARVFEDVFDDDTIKLSPQLTTRDVNGWDSITHVRLMLSIERAFKIRIKTSEIGELQNVGDLAVLIRARV